MEDSVSAGSGNGVDIDTQAAAWAVRSAERPLDSAEQQQLDAWLEADSRHAEIVRGMTAAGVAVCAHVGLLPQRAPQQGVPQQG